MKIAVATDDDMVTKHFGHCQCFNVYEVKDGQIVSGRKIANPGHKPGYLPKFLNNIGVNVIISGGMGGGAIEIFDEKGIEVITGASGSSTAAANHYLQGELKSSGTVCHEHQHRDVCEN